MLMTDAACDRFLGSSSVKDHVGWWGDGMPPILHKANDLPMTFRGSRNDLGLSLLSGVVTKLGTRNIVTTFSRFLDSIFDTDRCTIIDES